MSKFGWLYAGILALVSAACAGPAVVAESPGLDGTNWTLATLAGRAVEGGPVVTTQFSGGRIAGSDGCNRYSGAYQADGAKFSLVGSLAGTQMACPPAVMERARVFLSALSEAKSYRVAEGRLELQGADGAVLASFTAQLQSLAGTSWRVTGINNGRQAVESVAQDAKVTLAFDASGRVSGSAGCNRYTAAYTVEGTNTTIAPAAATRMACPQPGVMERERQFLDALTSVRSARIEGDRLELRTATDALAISAVRGD